MSKKRDYPLPCDRFVYDEGKDNEPAAFARFVSIEGSFNLKMLRSVHREGWRAGVMSVKYPDEPPEQSKSFGFKGSKKCYESAYINGREAALQFLKSSGKHHLELI